MRMQLTNQPRTKMSSITGAERERFWAGRSREQSARFFRASRSTFQGRAANFRRNSILDPRRSLSPMAWPRTDSRQRRQRPRKNRGGGPSPSQCVHQLMHHAVFASPSRRPRPRERELFCAQEDFVRRPVHRSCEPRRVAVLACTSASPGGLCWRSARRL